MTIKEFIGNHSIDEITKRVFDSLDGRDVELDECFCGGIVNSKEDWFRIFDIRFMKSDVCQKCEHRYSTYDSRGNYYEWCTYLDRESCAYEKEWSDCIFKKIKEQIETVLLKELAE